MICKMNTNMMAVIVCACQYECDHTVICDSYSRPFWVMSLAANVCLICLLLRPWDSSVEGSYSNH
jgi:hypothetical protein